MENAVVLERWNGCRAHATCDAESQRTARVMEQRLIWQEGDDYLMLDDDGKENEAQG